MKLFALVLLFSIPAVFGTCFDPEEVAKIERGIEDLVHEIPRIADQSDDLKRIIVIAELFASGQERLLKRTFITTLLDSRADLVRWISSIENNNFSSEISRFIGIQRIVDQEINYRRLEID